MKVFKSICVNRRIGTILLSYNKLGFFKVKSYLKDAHYLKYICCKVFLSFTSKSSRIFI